MTFFLTKQGNQNNKINKNKILSTHFIRRDVWIFAIFKLWGR
uniref:Uncharacterized protein n=1 Tax=viral metagenome TaxID=1070528 RepID=A0A6C0LZV7_9ZZZZ